MPAPREAARELVRHTVVLLAPHSKVSKRLEDAPDVLTSTKGMSVSATKCISLSPGQTALQHPAVHPAL
jgi:hypothetical protein